MRRAGRAAATRALRKERRKISIDAPSESDTESMCQGDISNPFIVVTRSFQSRLFYTCGERSFQLITQKGCKAFSSCTNGFCLS